MEPRTKHHEEHTSSKGSDTQMNLVQQQIIPPRAPPEYRFFDKTDIKSRLPRSFLDRSHLIIRFFCFSQIFLGICTGVLLNLSGVAASGAFLLILFPWVISIASFFRRFSHIRKAVNALRRGEDGGEAIDVAMPQNWERRTTRRGEWYFVDHQNRSTTWVAPEGMESGNRSSEIGKG